MLFLLPLPQFVCWATRLLTSQARCAPPGEKTGDRMHGLHTAEIPHPHQRKREQRRATHARIIAAPTDSPPVSEACHCRRNTGGRSQAAFTFWRPKRQFAYFQPCRYSTPPVLPPSVWGAPQGHPGRSARLEAPGFTGSTARAHPGKSDSLVRWLTLRLRILGSGPWLAVATFSRQICIMQCRGLLEA